MTDHPPEDTPLAKLLELARITPADIEHAKAAWRENARPAAKGLLEAQPIPAKRLRGRRDAGRGK